MTAKPIRSAAPCPVVPIGLEVCDASRFCQPVTILTFPPEPASESSTTPESVIDVALSLKAMATTTPLVSTLTVVFSDVALADPTEFE
jgi:hypothetical protein